MIDLTNNAYIVADPRICHGKVKDVLEMVADDMDWDTIVDQWRGSVTKEAIAEAVRLATQALILQVKSRDLAATGG